MSWAQVARKDFEDVIKSGMFWAVMGVSLLLMAIVTFGVSTGGLDEQGQEIVYSLFDTLGTQLVIPVVALVFAYMAITGERESGSLRILFGLGHNRRDVVVGKFASRSGVMIIGALVSCAVVAGLILSLFDSFDTDIFYGFVGMTVLLTLAFTGIAIGVSAMSRTRARAMSAAIGSYVLFKLLWHPFVGIIHYALEGELAGAEAPDWYLGLLMLNPLEAYSDTLGQLLDQPTFSLIDYSAIVEDIPREAMRDQTALFLANRAGEEVPFFLEEWFAAVVLLAWFVVPVLVGLWKFERADLN